jgi:nucleoside phosphorylase
MVIDIAIPEHVSADVIPEGGIRLLEDLAEGDAYIKPNHIIGLTAYEALLDRAQSVFTQYDWHVVHYRVESEQWEIQLSTKARYILAAQSPALAGTDDYCCDIAIVCAMRSPELAAVKSYLPWGWGEHSVRNDHGMYYRGHFAVGRATYSAIAAAAPRVGMSAAAVLASKMILYFRPRFIVLAGIAAGVPSKVKLGDIVVGDECWDYGSGKVLEENMQLRLRIAPHQICLAPDVRSRLQVMAEDSSWLERVRAEWSQPGPDTRPTMHIGPLASGAAVLASADAVQGVVDQHRSLLAIEMEGYGMLSASNEAPSPRPTAIVIKAISDFADKNKNDDYQRYAAYTSACGVKRFAELMFA